MNGDNLPTPREALTRAYGLLQRRDSPEVAKAWIMLARELREGAAPQPLIPLDPTVTASDLAADAEHWRTAWIDSMETSALPLLRPGTCALCDGETYAAVTATGTESRHRATGTPRCPS